MKIAVIGATGFVGRAITDELTQRKHEVTAISRNPQQPENEHLTARAVDINDKQALAEAVSGADAVVSAFNPGWQNPEIYRDFLAGAKSIQAAVKESGVKRFITIGGGGSLYVAPGVQAVDGEQFPAEYKQGALAARDYLNEIREEKELDWAFFSPAFEMHQGITTGRTGSYRLGKENPVFNEEGRSILSVEDLAVVIADELENPRHHRERFTAAY